MWSHNVCALFGVVPMGHTLQYDAPCSEYLPDGHCSQNQVGQEYAATALSAAVHSSMVWLNFPAGQMLQSVAICSGRFGSRPARHLSHTTPCEFPSSETSPREHGRQPDRSELRSQPSGHQLHVSLSEYVPFVQSRQRCLFSSGCCAYSHWMSHVPPTPTRPAGQATHVDRSTVGSVPESQATASAVAWGHTRGNGCTGHGPHSSLSLS